MYLTTILPFLPVRLIVSLLTGQHGGTAMTSIGVEKKETETEPDDPKCKEWGNSPKNYRENKQNYNRNEAWENDEGGHDPAPLRSAVAGAAVRSPVRWIDPTDHPSRKVHCPGGGALHHVLHPGTSTGWVQECRSCRSLPLPEPSR